MEEVLKKYLLNKYKNKVKQTKKIIKKTKKRDSWKQETLPGISVKAASCVTLGCRPGENPIHTGAEGGQALRECLKV